jgi:hypothetical protein
VGVAGLVALAVEELEGVVRRQAVAAAVVVVEPREGPGQEGLETLGLDLEVNQAGLLAVPPEPTSLGQWVACPSALFRLRTEAMETVQVEMGIPLPVRMVLQPGQGGRHLLLRITAAEVQPRPLHKAPQYRARR